MARPVIIRTPEAMQEWSRQMRAQGMTIGFVPTMGYLHEGHLDLMRIARQQADLVVISIFVNPLQFGPSEDLDRYPRDLEGDLDKAASVGVDLVFAPTARDMYPEGFQTSVDVSELSKPLCGAKRPGHFRGVTTVVAKLFNIVLPHFAVFGRKDYQQLQVIKRMVRDLSMNLDILEGETVRESDGLAMSSRNAYLSPEERSQATVLYRALTRTRQAVLDGRVATPEEAVRMAEDIISSAPLARIDYVECLDASELVPRDDFSRPMVLATAVFFGKTRLIDNILIPATLKGSQG